MSQERLAIGVDLGGTKIASALVSSSGEVLASRQALTGASDGVEAVLDRLAVEIGALVEFAPEEPAGVGIGSPGWGDYRQGIIHSALNLYWQDVDVVGGVNARLHCSLPVWLEKDSNASLLGEYYFGAGQGCQDLVYFSIGTGLGSGIIANGQIVHGAQQIAADLGHVSLDPNGRLCGCGMHGCAETIVSGPGLVAVASERLTKANTASVLNIWMRDRELSPALILEAARQGDSLAKAVFDEAGKVLGLLLAVSVSVLDPQRIIIGGGLGMAAFDLFAVPARQEIVRRILPSRWQFIQIVPSQLASSAIGAACLVWQRRKE